MCTALKLRTQRLSTKCLGQAWVNILESMGRSLLALNVCCSGRLFELRGVNRTREGVMVVVRREQKLFVTSEICSRKVVAIQARRLHEHLLRIIRLRDEFLLY